MGCCLYFSSAASHAHSAAPALDQRFPNRSDSLPAGSHFARVRRSIEISCLQERWTDCALWQFVSLEPRAVHNGPTKSSWLRYQVVIAREPFECWNP
jgi:hypothetical protein